MKNVRDAAGINHFTLEATDHVLPCPFCGETEFETDLVEGGIQLVNTHTASYWIECPCGAEVHGESFERCRTMQRSGVEKHRKAAESALALWNARVTP